MGAHTLHDAQQASQTIQQLHLRVFSSGYGCYISSELGGVIGEQAGRRCLLAMPE